jgi:hypothetical protein
MYSPKEISKYAYFDSYDFDGNSIVVGSEKVIYETFEYVGF